MHDFQPLAITEVRREMPDAISVALAVPAGVREDFRFRPGQHLALRAMLDGEEVRRTYSICSGAADQHLRIAIKRVAGGRFSNWANDTLRPGMTLESMPPAGRFMLPDGDGRPRHIVAFAAGAGITPIIAMVKAALAEPLTEVSLFYGNRTAATILFREELEDLKDAHVGRLTLAHVLSRGDGADVPLLQGRIDGARIEAIATKLLRLDAIAHVLSCGPGSMIKEARDTLARLGLPRERFHYEFFAPGGGAYQIKPAPAPAAGETAGAAEAIVMLDGVQHHFMVAPGEHVVDAGLRAGVRVPYSCKGGMCCTCRAKLIEGQVTMDTNYSLEPWEVSAGYVLTCQSRPLTPKLRLDFDQT